MKSKKHLLKFGRSQGDPHDELSEDVESETPKLDPTIPCFLVNGLYQAFKTTLFTLTQDSFVECLLNQFLLSIQFSID